MGANPEFAFLHVGASSVGGLTVVAVTVTLFFIIELLNE